jgi:hypothetical protein
MPYATNNPYELWSLHKSIGVMRDVLPAYTFFLDQFHGQVDSTDEYIDFEKLPRSNRKLAPFVMPMGQGKPIYTDRSTAYRFKPAYIKLRDAVDTTRGLSKIPGIDAMLTPNAISPMQRRELRPVAVDDINDVFYNGSYVDVVISFYGTDKGGNGIFSSIEAIRSWQEGDRMGGGIQVDDDDFDDLDDEIAPKTPASDDDDDIG